MKTILEQTIAGCTVDGHIIKLPPTQLNRNDYEEVKKALEGIGGKWKGGKVNGFQFKYDPSGLLVQLQADEQVDLKQQFQFFETPAALADRLVELADIRSGLEILEPSAGQGSIVRAIRRQEECAIVDCYELMATNRYLLNKEAGVNLLSEDFTKETPIPRYDRIVANPPFTKGQDIDHIRLMYDWLNDEGRLVSIASTSWQHNSASKFKDFRDWLNQVGGQFVDIDAGAFKESGTNVKSCIIFIDKTGAKLPDGQDIAPELDQKEVFIPELYKPPEYYIEQILDIEASMRSNLMDLVRILNPDSPLLKSNQKKKTQKTSQPLPNQLPLFT